MLIDDYYKLHTEFSKKYGENTIVLIQVGGFYEMYAEGNDSKNFSPINTDIYPDLVKIVDILNINYQRTNKNKPNSPYMAGFPIASLHKHLKKLLKNNYYVIVVQQEEKNGEILRNQQDIYTPSTYMDDVQTNLNYMVGLYLEISDTDLIAKKAKSGHVYYLGITILDITTGELNYLEEHFFSIEKLSSFISSFNLEIQPKEYILFTHDLDIEFNTDNNNILTEILKYLGKKYIHVDVEQKYNNKHYKLDFQKEFFNRIYNAPLDINIFEYLNLSRHEFARTSILLTLDFCHSLNDKLLKYIQKPRIYKSNNLIIGNDGISQLNIVDNNNLSVYNNSYKSVYDVINHCITPMGKRFLYKRLVNPSVIDTEISLYYEISESLRNNYNEIVDTLKTIKDIERLSRKIMVANIMPNELNMFYETIEQVKYLLNFIDLEKINNLFKLTNYGINLKWNDFNTFQNFFKNNFKIDRLKNCSNLRDLKENFINDQELIKLESVMKKDDDIYESSRKKFVQLLAEKKEVQLEIKDNKEGKFISTTIKRGKKIEEQLDEKSKEKYDFVYKKACQIFINKTDNQNVNEVYEEFLNLSRTKYYQIIEQMCQFADSFYLWGTITSLIDFCLNNLTLLERYGYTKPIIKKLNTTTDKSVPTTDKSVPTTDKSVPTTDKFSYIKAENLRHSVIERILEKEYIPNNINLGNDNHILLFGINSSGKSSLQKSLGISLILAQAGCYVPASKFEYYPYKKLYVRITGNDNIFKGLSSFSVEMNELKTILENKGNETLVIGDEVCRGTENISAVSILGSALIELTKSNTSFIFATHYHEIVDLEEIKNLNMSIFHMSVSESEEGKLIYGRHLLPGKCENNYGLVVAKSIIKDTNFVKNAEKFSREMNNQKVEFLSTKSSRYNVKLFMDQCSICNSIDNLEAHHILQQKDSDKYKVIDKPHIRKNSLANLIVLCEKCHDKIHNQNAVIKKVDTNDGIKIIVS
jgi:DNA mismatch repair protein MutS